MENDFNENKAESFFKRQGFYIVLALCLVVIGAAVLIVALPSSEVAEEADPAPIEIVDVGGSNDESLNADKPTGIPTATPSKFADILSFPTLAPSVSPTPAPTPTTKPASAPGKAQAPLKGDIIWGYAVDRLIYSKTLDQWTTHEGIDIAAALGSEVECVMGGTVAQVYEDDALGFTVVVSHSNGRKSLYANLAADIRVKEGDKINAGTIIGSVGNSAITECALEPHLHFAFYVDDKSVDPAKYVKVG